MRTSSKHTNGKSVEILAAPKVFADQPVKEHFAPVNHECLGIASFQHQVIGYIHHGNIATDSDRHKCW
jgi:hypothetical protein